MTSFNVNDVAKQVTAGRKTYFLLFRVKFRGILMIWLVGSPHLCTSGAIEFTCDVLPQPMVISLLRGGHVRRLVSLLGWLSVSRESTPSACSLCFSVCVCVRVQCASEVFFFSLHYISHCSRPSH